MLIKIGRKEAVVKLTTNAARQQDGSDYSQLNFSAAPAAAQDCSRHWGW